MSIDMICLKKNLSKLVILRATYPIMRKTQQKQKMNRNLHQKSTHQKDTLIYVSDKMMPVNITCILKRPTKMKTPSSHLTDNINHLTSLSSRALLKIIKISLTERIYKTLLSVNVPFGKITHCITKKNNCRSISKRDFNRLTAMEGFLI